MLYSEFVEGTGCKENDYNYRIYKDLEILYMNSDRTKQEIYAYGKKLVDNSDSPETIELKRRICAEIDSHKENIKAYKGLIEYQQQFVNIDIEKRAVIKEYKRLIKKERQQIKGLLWVLQ